MAHGRTRARPIPASSRSSASGCSAVRRSRCSATACRRATSLRSPTWSPRCAPPSGLPKAMRRGMRVMRGGRSRRGVRSTRRCSTSAPAAAPASPSWHRLSPSSPASRQTSATPRRAPARSATPSVRQSCPAECSASPRPWRCAMGCGACWTGSARPANAYRTSAAGGAGTVKELLEVLALPPANLPLLAVAGLIVQRWYPRLGEWLTAASCVLLIVLSMPFVGETLLVSLEHGLPSDAVAGGKPGAIVILTGDIERFGGDEPGFGPGRLTLDRERAGSILFRRVELPVLVTGGVLQG